MNERKDVNHITLSFFLIADYFLPILTNLSGKAESTSQTFQSEVIGIILAVMTLILLIAGFLYMIGQSALGKKVLYGLILGFLLIVFSGPLSDFLKGIIGR